MPVISKDIERKAEVFHSTVSRALKPHVASAHETAERIHRLMRTVSRVTRHFAGSVKISRSHRLGIIAHRPAHPFYSKVQGGLENVTHSLVMGNSFFTSVYRNGLGIYMTVVFIHHRAVEILLHSLYYDDLNAISTETVFA